SGRVNPDGRPIVELVVGHRHTARFVDVDGLAASLLDGHEYGCATPHPLCYPISHSRAHLILRAPVPRESAGAHPRGRAWTGLSPPGQGVRPWPPRPPRRGAAPPPPRGGSGPRARPRRPCPRPPPPG